MSDENDWLGDLPGIREIFRDGVAFIRRKALDFKGPGWTVADNPLTGRTDVSVSVPDLATALAEDETVLAAVAGTVGGFVDSGTYTPDVDFTDKCTVNSISATWVRTGGAVVVFVLANITNTASGAKLVGLDLPTGLPAQPAPAAGSPLGGGVASAPFGAPVAPLSVHARVVSGESRVTLVSTYSQDSSTTDIAAWFTYPVARS